VAEGGAVGKVVMFEGRVLDEDDRQVVVGGCDLRGVLLR